MPGRTAAAGVVQLNTAAMGVFVVDTVEAVLGLCRGTAVVEELGSGTVVGVSVVGTPDAELVLVELGTGSAVVEVELGNW